MTMNLLETWILFQICKIELRITPCKGILFPYADNKEYSFTPKGALFNLKDSK
jgi:hypothetical protein